MSEARNYGIRNANGVWICFLDGDDKFYPKALEFIFNEVQSFSLDMCFFDMEAFADRELKDDTMMKEYQEIVHREFFDIEAKSGRELLIEMGMVGAFKDMACGLCVKRELLYNQRLFFEKGIQSEDHIFSRKCFIAAKRAKYINKALYGYRIRQYSLGKIRDGEWRLYSLVRIWAGIVALLENHRNDKELCAALCKSSKYIGLEIQKINRHLEELNENYERTDAATDFLYAGLGIGMFRQHQS